MKATIHIDKISWYAFVEYEEIYGKILYRSNSIGEVKNKLLANGFMEKSDAFYKE